MVDSGADDNFIDLSLDYLPQMITTANGPTRIWRLPYGVPWKVIELQLPKSAQRYVTIYCLPWLSTSNLPLPGRGSVCPLCPGQPPLMSLGLESLTCCSEPHSPPESVTHRLCLSTQTHSTPASTHPASPPLHWLLPFALWL